MNRVSRVSALLVGVVILSAVAPLARAAFAAECPNKFGDQKEVSGGGADEGEAKKELAKALKTALDEAAADCKDKTCTEPKAKCRFVHTVTKINCKEAPNIPGGPKIICARKYRPGCFCLKEDEEIELKAIKPAGKQKKE
jgi:hypothetical protein